MIIARIENASPELNSKSPSFNQRPVDVVFDNQKRLIASGLAADVALERGYQDYISARQVQVTRPDPGSKRPMSEIYRDIANAPSLGALMAAKAELKYRMATDR